MVLMTGLRRTSPLWFLGSPYNLDALELCHGSCSVTSSRGEDPLRRRVVFCSVDCVGSLASFLCDIIQKSKAFSV